ncbi:MAG TPA: DUF3098 domain-containing protein [Bacteroidales bacterium]|jgi:SNF family Na+-dependent transporter|nr:DUF3098 domain-containing protein [Bacteroidales bacterium]
MAKVIQVENKAKVQSNQTTKGKSSSKKPLFRKTNYILMVVGVVLLGLGYILLSGGGSKDPDVFSDAIFDTRRLVVSPILIVLGLVIEIYAIMWHPKTPKE